MPYGKGTYGKQVGRPSNNQKATVKPKVKLKSKKTKYHK
jgi:hypothetical protein|tara:strand:- start:541 stop:657 length:117 start_codon:yes stop_codon:yes gene_type:complete